VSDGSSFHVAFRILPPERRRAIEAVYGFCRRADDAVDEAPDAATARASLTHVAGEVEALFGGRSATGEAADLRELRYAVDRFGLPREPFDLLLEGVRWDLEGRTYATTPELREYCRRVASSVGRLCVRIFGCPGGRCDTYADELGVALQWTNILRDLSADLARGRSYLPASSLALHGVTVDDLRQPTPARRERIARLVRSEAAYARACFEAADRALPAEDRIKVLPGRIMGAVYEKVLERIEWAGAAVLDSRIRLPRLARPATALRVVARERAREWVGAGH
jgi:phytoene synthase